MCLTAYADSRKSTRRSAARTSARMAAPRVRAVELSRSIVREQVSIFANCASLPRMPRISC